MPVDVRNVENVKDLVDETVKYTALTILFPID